MRRLAEHPESSDAHVKHHVVNSHSFVVKTAVRAESHFNMLGGGSIQDHPEPRHVRVVATAICTYPTTVPEGLEVWRTLEV